MAKFQSLYARGRQIAPYDDSGDVVTIRVDFAVSAAMIDSSGVSRANFSANDVIELFDLPAGHVPVDAYIACDDIDSNGAPAVLMSLGIINTTDNGIDTAAANGGAAWIASSNVGQAGGFVRPTTVAIARCSPVESSARRRVGLHIATAPATLQAGTITVMVSYRSAHYGT